MGNCENRSQKLSLNLIFLDPKNEHNNIMVFNIFQKFYAMVKQLSLLNSKITVKVG